MTICNSTWVTTEKILRSILQNYNQTCDIVLIHQRSFVIVLFIGIEYLLRFYFFLLLDWNSRWNDE